MSGTTSQPVTVEMFHSHGENDEAALARFNTFMSGPVVALTGARASTAYGDNVAQQFGHELARQGVTLLVGGSYGIEAAAIRGALSYGGNVVVVLPSGVDKLYPSGNAKLFETVLASGGMVTSLLENGAVPSRTRFTDRATFIAKVCGAVVVVEAGLRSSALMMARTAAGAGLPVFAVPGPVSSIGSTGPHSLIREGTATLVTDVLDLDDVELFTGRGITVTAPSA